MRFLTVALAFTLSAAASAEDGTSYKALVQAGTAAAKPTLIAQYGADNIRRGELRLPRGRGRFPVAVLIHGGCWDAQTGDPGDMASLASALADRGIATWNIEYRRVGNPGGGWPGTFEDVGAGVDYLRVLARKYPLDLNRVAVVGHSSGAHLALWAVSRRQLHNAIAGANPLGVQTAVAIDGPASLAPFIGIDSQVCGHAAIVPLMGGTPAQRPGEYKLASPAEHLPLGVHQLLIEGEFRPLMEPYVAAARSAGDRVDKLAPAGADHFDILNPHTPNGASVLEFIVDNVGSSAAAPLRLVAPALAAGNLWLGTWSLVLRDAGQKPETLIYSGAGDGAMRMVSVEDRSEIVSHLDGKPALDTGAGATNQHALAIRLMSPTDYTWTLFKEGKPWVRGENILAADRKSFKEVSWLIAKPEQKLTFIYERR